MSKPAAPLDSIIHRNVPFALRRYLRRLAQVAVVGGALGAHGCVTSHVPPTDEFEAVQCDESQWQAAQGLRPALEVDAITVMHYEGFVAEAWPLDHAGTLCSTAADPAACEVEVDQLRQETYGRYVLTTHGSEVSVHQGDAELIDFLGTIDTPNEALLRVWAAGYHVRCDDPGRAGVREVAGGYEVLAASVEGGCGAPMVTSRHLLMVDAASGAITELGVDVVERVDDPGCAGRRPAGLAAAEGSVANDPLGRWLASIARLEESAVIAFRALAEELEAHGAPASLVDGAREAADDEVRHAAEIGRLARKHGATPLSADVAEHRLRPLFEIALENAIEGCVRETYGALVAHHQALAAEEEEVARTMATIAEEESRHAELSWALAAWAEPRLSPAQREELRIAQARAVSELRAEMALAIEPELAQRAGLPRPEVAVAMLDHMSAALL